MKSAEFENIVDAAIYRKNHGGWLFISERNEATWFNAAIYTASMIMLKMKGDGVLVCDDRFVPAQMKRENA